MESVLSRETHWKKENLVKIMLAFVENKLNLKLDYYF